MPSLFLLIFCWKWYTRIEDDGLLLIYFRVGFGQFPRMVLFHEPNPQTKIIWSYLSSTGMLYSVYFMIMLVCHTTNFLHSQILWLELYFYVIPSRFLSLICFSAFPFNVFQFWKHNSTYLKNGIGCNKGTHQGGIHVIYSIFNHV